MYTGIKASLTWHFPQTPVFVAQSSATHLSMGICNFISAFTDSKMTDVKNKACSQINQWKPWQIGKSEGWPYWWWHTRHHRQYSESPHHHQARREWTQATRTIGQNFVAKAMQTPNYIFHLIDSTYIYSRFSIHYLMIKSAHYPMIKLTSQITRSF